MQADTRKHIDVTSDTETDDFRTLKAQMKNHDSSIPTTHDIHRHSKRQTHHQTEQHRQTDLVASFTLWSRPVGCICVSRAVRRPRRAAADNLWAPPPPTFVDRRAAADNLSARRRYHCCCAVIFWNFR